MSFTCLSCAVRFVTPEEQRDHYKQDWHSANLKRKVASLPPITHEEYENLPINVKRGLNIEEEKSKKKILSKRKESRKKEIKEEPQSCYYCSKTFNTYNALLSHLNSKKHMANIKAYLEWKKDNEHSVTSDSDSFVKVTPDVPDQAAEVPSKFVVLNPEACDDEDIETDTDIEELDSDEWEECRIEESDSLIKPSDCLFCGHHSKNIVKNLKHMSESHSFFIPDVEYCINTKGLLLYLGEKISRGYICLWCNEKGRTFYSSEAVQGHMIAKGHCKMFYEGLALAEYADYYDYSSSYPDQEKTDGDVGVDEEVQEPITLEGDDIQLVLPSGITVGHRSLMRYYKQNLTHNSQALVKKPDRKLHKLLAVYRSLGWTPKEQASVAKTARDVHFMKRIQAKLQMKLSVKANKFQKHYRPQVNF